MLSISPAAVAFSKTAAASFGAPEKTVSAAAAAGSTSAATTNNIRTAGFIRVPFAGPPLFAAGGFDQALQLIEADRAGNDFVADHETGRPVNVERVGEFEVCL